MAISSSSVMTYSRTFSKFCLSPVSREDVSRIRPRFSVRDEPTRKTFDFAKILPTFQSEGRNRWSGLSLPAAWGSSTRRALNIRMEHATDDEDLGKDSRPNFMMGTGLGFTVGLSVFGNTAEAAQASTAAFSTDVSGGVWLSFVSVLGDLDPGTAQLAITFGGPVITLFNLLLIFRIVMSWYPGIPVKKFPFFLAYNPTEPILGPTRKLIPPVGGVDVAPVIWVALMSFTNEILLGKQGLLVLLSQQQR